jgi:hypothetical protein
MATKNKRIPRNKRDANTVARLWEKFGDLPASEMFDRLQNRRAGRRQKWDLFGLKEIFLCVEAFKARGVPQRRRGGRRLSFSGPATKWSRTSGARVATASPTCSKDTRANVCASSWPIIRA